MVLRGNENDGLFVFRDLVSDQLDQQGWFEISLDLKRMQLQILIQLILRGQSDQRILSHSNNGKLLERLRNSRRKKHRNSFIVESND